MGMSNVTLPTPQDPFVINQEVNVSANSSFNGNSRGISRPLLSTWTLNGIIPSDVTKSTPSQTIIGQGLASGVNITLFATSEIVNFAKNTGDSFTNARHAQVDSDNYSEHGVTCFTKDSGISTQNSDTDGTCTSTAREKNQLPKTVPSSASYLITLER